MQKLTLDTLVLRDTTVATSSAYLLQGADGLESPDYRLVSYDKPGISGSGVSNNLYGSRLVTITGEINTSDAASYSAARSALLYACRYQTSSTGSPQATILTFTTLDGTAYFTGGFVKSLKFPLKYPTWCSFIIQFFIPDPALYMAGLVSSGQVTRPAGGGVTYPVTYPAIYGASTGGIATFTNSGTEDTYPVIYLRGAVTNPTITFGTVSMSLLVTTSNATDVIAIDMGNRTIVLNGSTSLLTDKTSDSSWFSLPAGTNTLRFSTGSAGDTGTMEVTAYSAVIGV